MTRHMPKIRNLFNIFGSCQQLLPGGQVEIKGHENVYHYRIFQPPTPPPPIHNYWQLHYISQGIIYTLKAMLIGHGQILMMLDWTDLHQV